MGSEMCIRDRVKNLTPYGVFVELEEGIGGMIHISDLSWTKRFNHPSEYTKVGETIDISILEIDLESRKLALGHKQLEQNPWDTFENVFPVGSYHEVTLLKKDDRGGVVQLPYGLEAYAPIRHLRKEDNTMAEVDDTLTVKVLEFNRDDKRILVSHSRYIDDLKRKADDEVRKTRGQERAETRRNIQQRSAKMEKTTLGELDVFSQLKDRSNTSGIQYQLGPISNVNPSASNARARPPIALFFSNMVTSWPYLANRHAADRPAKPEPTIPILPNGFLI